jgi:hypothetical protein
MVIDGHPVNADSLVVPKQMWRCISAGADPSGQQQLLQQPDARTFAIGAGNDENRSFWRLQIKAVCNFSNPIQAKVDFACIQ